MVNRSHVLRSFVIFAAAAEEPSPKKEGFFAKLKDKITFHHHPKPAEDEAVAV
jgi:hypothetical protein